MDLDFWNERWERGETGFHQVALNPYLGYYYGEKGASPGQRKSIRVFVPLCGKTLDMHWLSQNGYAVVGVECSEIAVRSFFEEYELPYQAIDDGKHVKYVCVESGKDSDNKYSSVEILLGDFFDLKQSDLGDITDIFDRAALIALPYEKRAAYVKKLTELQKPGTRSLLVTLTYNQNEMDGPPFSVEEAEVHELYGKNFEIEILARKEILELEPRFQQRGLTKLTETAYKLMRL